MLAEVQRVRSSGGYAGTAGPRSRSPCATTPGPWRWSSSTNRGGPSSSREGTEAIFWGKVGDYRGTRQMVNPVVDVVAGVDEPAVGRPRRTLRILPVYPASAKAGLTSWEIGTFVEEALERAGEFVDPLPERVADRRWTCGTAPRPCGPSTGPSRWRWSRPARRRLVFDELFRLQLALVLRRRAFEHNARALRHEVSPPGDHRRGSSGTLVARFLAGAALRADHGAAPGAGGDRGRPGRPVPHAPAAPGRRRLGQDGGGAGRPARGGPERASGRADGADRGAGRAARGGRAPDAGRRSTSGWSC